MNVQLETESVGKVATPHGGRWRKYSRILSRQCNLELVASFQSDLVAVVAEVLFSAVSCMLNAEGLQLPQTSKCTRSIPLLT